MEGSSLLNAFRLLKRKPALLLLLLPLHLSISLLLLLMRNPAGAINDYPQSIAASEGLAVMLRMMSALGIEFVLYLLAGFLLIPPAMELLHDGAEGLGTQPGWYARGLKKHWWKPVTLGAMETAAFTVIGFILYVFLVIAMFASFSSVFLADSSDAGDYSNFAWPAIILMVLFAAVAVFIMYMIQVISAMLLPASADRGFGRAFKAVFSKTGFPKTMKVLGVYLLTDFLYMIVCVAIVIAYYIVRRLTASMDIGAFGSAEDLPAWAAVLMTALYSLVVIFKYTYIFSVFHEIKCRENPVRGDALPIEVAAIEMENSATQ